MALRHRQQHHAAITTTNFWFSVPEAVSTISETATIFYDSALMLFVQLQEVEEHPKRKRLVEQSTQVPLHRHCGRVVFLV